MKKRLILLLCLFQLFASINVAVAGATDDEAKKAFKRGTALYRENRFKEAADEFRKANELRPSWKILFNIGQCRAAAKQYGLALEAFESYLSQGGDDVPKDKRETVIEEIRVLREMVGYLSVEAPEGSQVFIDGLSRGTVPLPGPLPIGTGMNHDLEITRIDTVLMQKSIRVNSGKILTINTNPKQNRPPPKDTAEETAHTTPETTEPGAETQDGEDETEETPESTGNAIKGLRIAGFVTLGVGVGTLGAMAYTGVKTYNLTKENKSENRDEISKYQRTTNILIGVGSTLVLAGTTMVVVSYVTEKIRKRDNEADAFALKLTPIVALNAAGLAFTHTF